MIILTKLIFGLMLIIAGITAAVIVTPFYLAGLGALHLLGYANRLLSSTNAH